MVRHRAMCLVVHRSRLQKDANHYLHTRICIRNLLPGTSSINRFGPLLSGSLSVSINLPSVVNFISKGFQKSSGHLFQLGTVQPASHYVTSITIAAYRRIICTLDDPMRAASIPTRNEQPTVIRSYRHP